MRLYGPLSSKPDVSLVQLVTDVRDLCPNLPERYNVGMVES